MRRFLALFLAAFALSALAIGCVALLQPEAREPLQPEATEAAQPQPEATEAPRPRSDATATPTQTPKPTPRPDQSTPQQEPDPEALLQTILDTPIPARDPYALAQALKGIDGPRVACTEPPTRNEGDTRQLWISDLPNKTYFQITARLALITEHHYQWVQDDLDIRETVLSRAAEDFNQTVLPTLRDTFGREWSPGMDCDPRIHVVNGRIPGLGGYFSGADAFPAAVNRFSNEWEAIYINVESLRPGTSGYRCTLAHEYQHMIHWNVDANEDTWVNEGLSELASQLLGCPPSGTVHRFARRPDTELNTWAEDPEQTLPHYGAAYLFLSYLHQRFGDETLRRLVAEPENGIQGIEAALAGQATFDEVFQDWLVALLVDAAEGPFSIQAAEAPLTLDALSPGQGEVSQFAAGVLEVEDALRLTFQGEPRVRLLPASPRSGHHFWWSNRGDDADTRLTRSFDLTGMRRATLRFWVWYHIEEHFDYAYVQASTDGGQTWEVLPGRHTTTENPNGNSFGHAWTGRSNGWIEEEVDLSPYAGREVLVRFQYVTDDAVNTSGVAIDDLAIREIGYRDDAESAEGWRAEGFVHASEWLPQRWSLQVVHQDALVQRLGEGTALLDLPAGSVLIVSGLTPVTTEPARYTLTAR